MNRRVMPASKRFSDMSAEQLQPSTDEMLQAMRTSSQLMNLGPNLLKSPADPEMRDVNFLRDTVLKQRPGELRAQSEGHYKHALAEHER